MEPRRLKLVIEYDGTEFAGFQLQGQGERTVQGVLQSTISQMADQDIVVHGAGRTDSGVHARGQVVHFDSGWKIPIEKLSEALNGRLPRDISVRDSCEVDREFHSRFSARRRTYIYLSWTRSQRSALWGRFAAHEQRTLDISAMQSAASILRGKRDFSAFANRSDVEPPSMVRNLQRFDVRWMGNGSFIVYRLTADGFLRSMVRNLVGGLRSVGLGEMTPDDLSNIADTMDRAKNPCPAAEARGLCLWRVDY